MPISFIVLCNGVIAQDELADIKPSMAIAEGEVIESASSLTSTNLEIRRKALYEITSLKKKVGKRLTADLPKLLAHPHQDYDGPLHVTLKAIEAWNVQEAVDPLSSFITLQLNPLSFPVGELPTSSAFYPVASTIAEIGGAKAVKNIFHRLSYKSDDRYILIAGWVLQRIEGREVAQIIVERRLSDIEKVAKNIGGGTFVEQENLSKMLELLKSEGGIQLPPPETEVKVAPLEPTP